VTRKALTTEDLVRAFVTECDELLDRLHDLLAPLNDGWDRAGEASRLELARRALHTIKGTAAWLGFERLSALVRAGERLVARMRDGHRGGDRAAVEALLRLVSRAREVVREVRGTHGEGERDHRDLVALLTSLTEDASPNPSPPCARAAAEAIEPMLLFRAGGSRLAMPLAAVDRLEVLDPSAIERAGARSSVRCRDEVLDLVHAVDVLEERRARSRAPATLSATTMRAYVHVVVQSVEGRRLGLVVDRIEEAISERIEVQDNAARGGVLGAAVIRGSVTEIFDVRAAYRHLDASPLAASSTR
jgi:chemotaxis protein histidine kinase CheA